MCAKMNSVILLLIVLCHLMMTCFYFTQMGITTREYKFNYNFMSPTQSCQGELHFSTQTCLSVCELNLLQKNVKVYISLLGNSKCFHSFNFHVLMFPVCGCIVIAAPFFIMNNNPNSESVRYGIN